MRVAVVGSRRFPSRPLFDMLLARTIRQGDTIVSGGARGPDTWAEAYARANGLDVTVYPAAWETPCPHGARHERYHTNGQVYYSCQGHARNTTIVENCDRVVAFVMPDRTGGTEDTIRKALAAGKPVRCFLPDGTTTHPDAKRANAATRDPAEPRATQAAHAPDVQERATVACWEADTYVVEHRGAVMGGWTRGYAQQVADLINTGMRVSDALDRARSIGRSSGHAESRGDASA